MIKARARFILLVFLLPHLFLDLVSGCFPCSAGTYGTGVGKVDSGACAECSRGTYSVDIGLNVCIACGAGTYTWGTGTSSASECVATTTIPMPETTATTPAPQTTTTTTTTPAPQTTTTTTTTPAPQTTTTTNTAATTTSTTATTTAITNTSNTTTTTPAPDTPPKTAIEQLVETAGVPILAAAAAVLSVVGWMFSGNKPTWSFGTRNVQEVKRAGILDVKIMAVSPQETKYWRDTEA